MATGHMHLCVDIYERAPFIFMFLFPKLIFMFHSVSFTLVPEKVCLADALSKFSYSILSFRGVYCTTKFITQTLLGYLHIDFVIMLSSKIEQQTHIA
jgi:hypothetical protein